MPRDERNVELAWAIVRVAGGLGLAIFHGASKILGGKMPEFAKTVAALGFPAPLFFAWCAALTELVGGALVALGLASRVAASFAAFTMTVALFRHRVDPFAKSELALLYLSLMIAVVVRGSGRWGLDALLRSWRDHATKPSP